MRASIFDRVPKAVPTNPVRSYVLTLYIGIGLLAATVLFGIDGGPSQSAALADVNLASIEGQVTDALTKQPIAGAQVSAASGANGEKATTDANGHYALLKLQPGSYLLFAKAETYARSPVRAVQLAPSINLLHLNLELYKEATLSGVVSDQDRIPIKGAYVKAWVRIFTAGRVRFMLAAQTHTDELGHYALLHLGKGKYYITADVPANHVIEQVTDTSAIKHSELAYRSTFYPFATSFQNAAPVELYDGDQRSGLDLVMERMASFCVMTTLKATAAKQLTVMLSQISTGWYNALGGGSAVAGQNIKICGFVPDVRYSIGAYSKDQTPGSNNITQFARVDFTGTTHDAEEGVLRLGTISLEPPGTTDGHVSIDSEDTIKPELSTITIALEPRERGNFANESTIVKASAEGDFSFPALFNDEHWLKVSGLPPGFYVKQAEMDGSNLEVEPWRPGKGHITIVLGSDGASLAGRVVDGYGQPVADSQVIAVSKALLSTRDGALQNIASRRTDQGGQFQFASSLPPGSYFVYAVDGLPEQDVQDPEVVRAYLAHSTEVTLGGGARQLVTLSLLTGQH